MSEPERYEQLELFSPHRLALGEAWDALSDLDFARATELFSALVKRFPDSNEAAQGFAIAQHWCRVFDCHKENHTAESIDQIWQAFKRCPDHLTTPRLRNSLRRYLLHGLETAGLPYLPPDLPAGRLALELGQAKQAAKSLNLALRHHPDEGVLLAWLAKAEWALGHTIAARALWVRLILVAPSMIETPDLPDQECASLIIRYGIEWAPIYGWLDGILPLLRSIPKNAIPCTATRAYEHVIAAESARKRGDHAGTLSARRAIQIEAPQVLSTYLDYLETVHSD